MRLDDAHVSELVKDGIIRDEDETGFHSQDGLFFRRMDDGSVRVTLMEYTSGLDPRRVFQTLLPSSSWASVIASMSLRGENSFIDYINAVNYHMEPV